CSKRISPISLAARRGATCRAIARWPSSSSSSIERLVEKDLLVYRGPDHAIELLYLARIVDLVESQLDLGLLLALPHQRQRDAADVALHHAERAFEVEQVVDIDRRHRLAACDLDLSARRVEQPRRVALGFGVGAQ